MQNHVCNQHESFILIENNTSNNNSNSSNNRNNANPKKTIKVTTIESTETTNQIKAKAVATGAKEIRIKIRKLETLKNQEIMCLIVHQELQKRIRELLVKWQIVQAENAVERSDALLKTARRKKR